MSIGRDYFDTAYEASSDPFRLDDNWYEDRKYAITVAALPRPRYRRALEPGCSIGILTEKLKDHCDALTATDIVETALDSARARVDDPRVRFAQWSLTDDWDAVSDGQPFDLIVLSEVGYYLDEDDLCGALDAAVAHLEPGGTLLAVHWRHPVADYPLTGDEVHAVLGRTTGLARQGGYVDEDVILEVFAAADERPTSVARIEGLV